ncbi:MAG TPA: capsular biosynthesis protein [Ruminococcaceae bacterium]|nr:capsular biosynthesis protein [Oscillospiraceae bacterium]
MRPKAFLIMLSAAVIISGCEQRPAARPAMVQAEMEQEAVSHDVSEFEPQKSSATIMAVGDNLIHEAIYAQAKRRAGGEGYDFGYCYSDIAEIISSADIAVINQETPIAGKICKPSSYPLFNSPTELGDEIVKIGFDVFSHANNHILDKGTIGVSTTLDYYSTKPNAIAVGICRKKDDCNKIKTITKNGITFAFVAFTEHTNGLELPQDSELAVSYLGNWDLLQRQIEQADKTADIVAVIVHWGIEDSHSVTKIQRAYAEKMSQWGADIILGAHPHVLQQIEYIQPSPQSKTLVAYSLGNFISAQNKAPNLIGGILSITAEKDAASGKTEISKTELMPVITHYEAGYKNLKIIPFKSYTPELAEGHGVREYDSRFCYDFISQTLNGVIGADYLAQK